MQNENSAHSFTEGSDSGTIKFSNPVSPDRDPIPGYESIVTLMFSAFSHGVGVMGDDSFANWFNRNNMRASIERAFSDLLKENQELKAELQTLAELSGNLMKAMEQRQFFFEGYANGSASISECNEAASNESKAYSNLWNFLKNEGL